MPARNLHGKRYIGLIRCSSKGQVDTSIDDQRQVLDSYAREKGMTKAGEIALEGVTGSIPGCRQDIQQVIARKRDRNDFDILLVQDSSRLTRAGITHTHAIEHDLNTAGIEVVYVMENIPDGEVGNLVKSVQSFANNQHAKSISMASARGSMSSIIDDRSPHCRRPPYGIDRLYVTPDGQPLHVIRNLPDGTQIQIDPTTGETIRQFGLNAGTGTPNHYIKQRQERVILIPGDRTEIEVVQQIFRRALIDNRGTYLIAQELNIAGIPSPRGKTWGATSVEQILDNSTYLGEGIANRYTMAVYHMRGKDRPLPSNIDRQELNTRKQPARRTRTGDDWYIQQHDRLKDFLPPELRDLARQRQQRRLANQALGHLPKPDRDRHRNSSYVLKGILRSKQGNHPMTGRTQGLARGRVRYYGISRAYDAPDGNKLLRKLVPAEPVEQAVIEAVRATLLAMPNLRERVEHQVRAANAKRAQENEHLAEDLDERESIRRKLELIVDGFDNSMKDAIKEKLETLKRQLHAVDGRIAQSAAVPITDESAIQELVDRSVARIESLDKEISEASLATLPRLLQAMIRSLVVDLETREVTIEIDLPPFADGNVCLVNSPACKTGNEAHHASSCVLARFRLKWNRASRCYDSPQAA